MKTNAPRSYWIGSLGVLIFALAAATASAALVATPDTDQTEVRYLSGTGSDHTVAWDFYCDRGQNSKKWSTIAVPSNWELQGFGVYTYGYDMLPDLRAAARGGAKVDLAEMQQVVHAKYKHEFTVPTNWDTKRVFLVFEGSMTDTEVMVNGKSAGPIHRGGYYRFRYDVKSLLRIGSDQNTLEVNVTDVSSDPSVNNAERHGDYWNYGGIYRPVYLEASPLEYVDHIATDAQADGSFSVQAFLPEGISHADAVEAQLFEVGAAADGTPNGKAVGNAFSVKIEAGSVAASLKSKIDGVRQWTAETPNLYRLEVRLKQGQTVLHRMSKQIGFRTIEVREGDGIYVNGQRIMLKGCCRHTFWPESGRCTNEMLSELDVKMIRSMNMNAVRSSHYPPDQHFLDQCDQMGLYVLDELAGWHAHYETPVGKQLVQEMVTRDQNHPCILFWDNGNEGGWNNELNGEFDKYDPQNRHVLHPWEKFGGVNTKHYPDLTLAGQLASGADIFMPTEFNHGLYDGGAGAGLSQYWSLMTHSKVASGGFIWAYLDEDVMRTDQPGHPLDSNGNKAPDGILGPHREKEGSYYTVKQVWSPIQIAAPKEIGQNLSLEVENHYDFTDLQECGLKWELRHFAQPGDAKGGYDVLSSGTAAAQIKPHGVGKLELKLPGDWQKADAVAVIATDPHEQEVWTWVWAIDEAKLREGLTARLTERQTVTMRANETLHRNARAPMGGTLTAGSMVVSFDPATGQLANVKLGDKSFSLSHGPRLMTGESNVKANSFSKKGDSSVMEVEYSSGLKSVVWTLSASGVLTLDYQYEAGGQAPFTGITFDYPEANVKSKRWLGTGPYHVYGNRLEGGMLNVWETAYNDTVTGQTWDYPEFKGFFAGVRWMTLQTSEGPITMVPSAGLFVRVLSPKFPDAKLVGNTLVAYPPGDISFLQTIPPVGSKFKAAPALPPVPQGTYGGHIAFYFGDEKP